MCQLSESCVFLAVPKPFRKYQTTGSSFVNTNNIFPNLSMVWFYLHVTSLDAAHSHEPCYSNSDVLQMVRQLDEEKEARKSGRPSAKSKSSDTPWMKKSGQSSSAYKIYKEPGSQTAPSGHTQYSSAHVADKDASKDGSSSVTSVQSELHPGVDGGNRQTSGSSYTDSRATATSQNFNRSAKPFGGASNRQ